MKSGLRKAVLFISLLGISYIAYQYMIKPANKHLAAQKARVQAKLDRLEEFEQATTAAASLNKQVEQLQEAIGFFESKLPPTSEIDKVLHDVTVIVQKQGLRSKRVVRLKKEDNSGYVEQPLRVELEGNFNSFYSFLLELEKLPRIMKIRELELEKQIDDEGQIVADFVVSIFFQNKTG
ncbi:MAG: type 4a pilus biogenesis protein PilO [Planctomycetota bacterium]|jgi:type IV pilus assembly protein PilO|nr:MAG: type 4a pilus biogenesis protein PilO [Planctomycetota bacterium]